MEDSHIFVSGPNGQRFGPVIPPWMNARAGAYIDDGTHTFMWTIKDEATPKIPNAYDKEELFDNSVIIETCTKDDDFELALEFIAIHLSTQLHEMLEWVRVDGRRLACPHPESKMDSRLIPDRTKRGDVDGYGYWDWCIGKFKEIVKQYCDRYPPQDGD